MDEKVIELARGRRKTSESELARGVGQYVGLMYSVERLNQAIEYLTKERDEIMSVLLKPLALKEKTKE